MWVAPEIVADILCISPDRLRRLSETGIDRVIRRRAATGNDVRPGGKLEWNADDARELMRVKRKARLSLPSAIRALESKRRGDF